MNEQLSQWLMKALAEQAYDAISTEVEPLNKETSSMARMLESHHSWKQVIDALKRKLSDNIVRKTVNDTEIAFNRGGLHALESLSALIKRYALIKEQKSEEKPLSIDE
jgi:hypothetical protein